MAYRKIMANMPDEWIGQYTVGQVSTKQWSRWLVQVREFPQSWDQAVICHGIELQVHFAQHAGEHINVHLPEVGCQNRWVMVTQDPSTSIGFLASSGGIWTTVVGPLSTDSSPCRAQVISANPGGGHGDSWWDCSSMFSWEEAAGTSVSSVVISQPLPWAADRDLLEWAQQLLLWLWLQWGSHGVGSVSLGKLISTQLEGTVAVRTSSIKETSSSITHWSSTTLSDRWWGSSGIGSCAFSSQYWSTLV